MRKKYLYLLCILTIILTVPSFAAQLEIPKPNPSFYVYDGSNILNGEAEEYIIRTNEELYKRTGAQIVVVTIDSLEGANINQYAVELFEEWGIGSREYDNGLLMLIVTEERQLWIEVGYGLEGVLPDSKVGKIIEDSILPYFREDRYSEGIIAGFNSIIHEVEKEYDIQLERDKINQNLYNIDEIRQEDDIFSGFRGILIAIGFVIFLVIDFKFFNGFFTYSLLFRGGRYSSRGGRSNRGGDGRSGGGGAGGRW